MTAKDRLQDSLVMGFDKSYITEEGGVRVRCSQCEACVINGLAAHEHGCPNADTTWKDLDEDPEEEVDYDYDYDYDE